MLSRVLIFRSVSTLSLSIIFLYRTWDGVFSVTFLSIIYNKSQPVAFSWHSEPKQAMLSVFVLVDSNLM